MSNLLLSVGTTVFSYGKSVLDVVSSLGTQAKVFMGVFQINATVPNPSNHSCHEPEAFICRMNE